ncbi:right-handed parallel beta-helix repeat-containing protein [Nonomuraea sp. CA-141351]|uniref:right-handed parallel beta-helix repeat-containing protein n=1 Tax=Nonomuraea sp. CA-141351 TaxID=3239996 RepID=UPI003D8EF6BA
MRQRHLASVALGTSLVAVSIIAASATPALAVPPHPGRTTIVVSPSGDDHNQGTPGKPLRTLAAAQAMARESAHAGSAVTVELKDGTYQLDTPLRFTADDSGTSAKPVIWTAARGARPVVSGGRQVTGWTSYDDGKNIFVASVPKGQDSRQLYKNDTAAPRAAIKIARSDVTITASGMQIKNPALNYLATLPDQTRIEVESQGSFTDRYAPVQSISGTAITMQQPAWQNNNWGYDTLARPFAGGQLLLENSYAFLQEGQWYLDPSAGKLYYRAAAGEDPNSASFVLPHLESLVQIAGSYANPVHDLTFSGIRFSHSTWLSPGSSIGYADQQNGAFLPKAYPQPADYLNSCQSGCRLFEGARNGWHQLPAAVQVAAATRVTFSDNTFAHLGQVGLGIGLDANANGAGIGLGVTEATVHHNLFTDLGGAGVVAGGVLPDAHHPSDPAMTVRDITIDNNLVTDVAKDYKEMSGILTTYVDHAVIEHNEVSNLAYDGIDTGWGWGANDAGGSQDYRNRGLYEFQPVYTSPTTLKNTVVTGNLIHGVKKVFHDGGSLYNLSANPGAVFSGNYIYDTQHTVGLYLDEGSRYVTMKNNVVQDCGVWVFTNSYGTINNTSDNVLEHNWYNSGNTQTPNTAEHNNQLIDNVQVSGTAWPDDAKEVIAHAGIEPGLRTFPGVSQ